MARPRKKPLLQLDENDPLRCLLAALEPAREEISFSRQQIEILNFDSVRLASLTATNLLRPDSTRLTTNCFKCDRQCIGLSLMKSPKGTLGFVCPSFPTVGWIDVRSEQLERMRFRRDDLIRWLVQFFNCQPVYLLDEPELPAGSYRLGIVLVEQKRLQLFLQFNRKSGWQLKCAENCIALHDLLRFNGSEYVIDPDQKELLLWSDDSDEPPISRAARLLEEVEWRKTHRDVYPGAVYEQVAEENGITKATLEGILKKARQDTTILGLKRTYREKRLESQKTKITP